LAAFRSTLCGSASAIATPIADTLPKTRAGKIMRRVLKARALGMLEGDISTLDE
jgi:acetyl-CoA synthetase